MTFLSADFPDAAEALPLWLDEQLVGERLADLVAELAAVHGAEPPADAVADLLGADLEKVLAGGLGELPTAQLQRLLKQPYYFLQLRDLVFADGGPYWDRVPVSDETRRVLDAQWRSLLPKLRANVAAVTPPVLLEVAPRRGGAKSSWPWRTVLATAAATLVGVGVVNQLRPRPSGADWGWAKTGALPRGGDAKSYFRALAAGAREWSSRPPGDSVELALRIGELRQGCSVLLLAEHAPLSNTQRVWLRGKCSEWVADIDGALKDLESGKDPEAVRGRIESRVKALASALDAQGS